MPRPRFESLDPTRRAAILAAAAEELAASGLEGASYNRIIERAGAKASRRFLEFFLANIRNKNTRAAYARAARDFLAWCEERGLDQLERIDAFAVAAYIEQYPGSKPSTKQALAAIRKCFDWLVVHQVLRVNPATSVTMSEIV